MTFGRLMGLLSEVVVDYLKAQIEAGAQVVQLFDSWVGWLSPYDYELLVLPHVRYVIDKVKGRGAGDPLRQRRLGACSTSSAKAGQRRLSASTGASSSTAPGTQLGDVAVQGNLDPITLLGPPKAIEERVADVLRRAGGRPGTSSTSATAWSRRSPPDNVKYLVDAVHRLSAVSS